MRMLYRILTYIFLAFVLLNHTSLIHAQNTEYIVKPVIMIPSDWKEVSSETIETKFKPHIAQALEEVQVFFASKLDGKTFNFDRNVEVVYTKEATDFKIKNRLGWEFGNIGSVGALYDKLNGDQYLTPKDNAIYVVWIVGSKDLTATASLRRSQINPKNVAARALTFVFRSHGGVATLNHDNLLSLDPISEEFQSDKRHTNKRIDSLFTLVHELSHTFGLVEAGYAKGHPCTEITPEECIAGAPKPLPPEDEVNVDVVGHGGFLRGLFELRINNSYHNPELWKLYQSPFINPYKDPAPEPRLWTELKEEYQSYQDKKNAIKLGHTPETRAGEILTIFGGKQDKNREYIKGGLGKFRDKSKLVFESYFLNPPNYLEDFEIVEWQDDQIKVFIKPTAEKSVSTSWKIKIFSDNKLVAQSDSGFNLASNKQLTTTITVNSVVTCGDGKPFAGAKVSLTQKSPSDKLVSESLIDQEGKAQIVYEAYRANYEGMSRKLLDVYEISSSFENGLVAEPSSYILDKNTPIKHSIHGGKVIDVDSPFHFSQCPQRVTTTSEVIEGTPPPEKELIQIILSNYDDFREFNAPDDYGSVTQDFTNNEGTQSVEWTLSTLSTSNPLYIRKVYSDQSVEDSQIVLNSGQRIDIETISATAKRLKKIKNFTINNQEVSKDQLKSGFRTTLAGNALPIVINFTDGTNKYLAYNFNYTSKLSPPDQNSPPTEEPIPNQSPESTEEPSSILGTCPDDVYYPQDEGTDNGCVRKYYSPYPECAELFDTTVPRDTCRQD